MANLLSIMKFNPYHDEKGRFTTKEKGKKGKRKRRPGEFEFDPRDYDPGGPPRADGTNPRPAMHPPVDWYDM